MQKNSAWQSHFLPSKDGLRLHVRHIGSRASPLNPVICLAGLSRSSLDFEAICAAITAQDGRYVLAPDYRGRGLSDDDADWQRYDLMVELGDIQHILAEFGIERAIFIGTSRGGIITALMAMVQPQVIAGSIINDIGPVIEQAGLIRIKSYIGKIPTPEDYEGGASQLKAVFGAQFPALDDAAWLRFAKRSWRGAAGALTPNYDTRLMNTLSNFDAQTPMPDLWPQFTALNCAPLLVLRGALSDLLSQETAEAMVARHPAARLHVVADEGHAPLLEDAPSQKAILDFIGGL